MDDRKVGFRAACPCAPAFSNPAAGASAALHLDVCRKLGPLADLPSACATQLFQIAVAPLQHLDDLADRNDLPDSGCSRSMTSSSGKRAPVLAIGGQRVETIDRATECARRWEFLRPSGRTDSRVPSHFSWCARTIGTTG